LRNVGKKTGEKNWEKLAGKRGEIFNEERAGRTKVEEKNFWSRDALDPFPITVTIRFATVGIITGSQKS
jgi:hypothetical protein